MEDRFTVPARSGKSKGNDDRININQPVPAFGLPTLVSEVQSTPNFDNRQSRAELSLPVNDTAADIASGKKFSPDLKSSGNAHSTPNQTAKPSNGSPRAISPAPAIDTAMDVNPSHSDVTPQATLMTGNPVALADQVDACPSVLPTTSTVGSVRPRRPGSVDYHEILFGSDDDE